MRAVLRRVRQASVSVQGRIVGEFGADMDVSLVNWGPVTIWLDSDDL